uniref:ULP_PROTEASE domain-containing protein n=1 Tax=Hydatigena taeniaeformis TaxID=6205 RepID=A0A0R3WQK7_HYDTA
LSGHWIAVYTACGCACLLGNADLTQHLGLGFNKKLNRINHSTFVCALFIRDKDAHCVGFTNNICAAICDPFRKGHLEEEMDDSYDVFEADVTPSINLQKNA